MSYFQVSPRVGCAALISDILPRAGQDAGQGQLGDVGGLPTVLDIAQLGDDGPQAHVVVVTSLPSVSIIFNLKYKWCHFVTR